MAKLSFDQKVLGLDGNPITNEKEEPYNFGTLIGSILIMPLEGDSADDKFKAYGLATKLYGAQTIDVDADEISLILDRVGRLGNPLVFGRVKEFVNGK